MKVAAYLRVSTDRQAEEGLGLEVQEQTIRGWARQHGHRVVLWARDEGVSGSNGLDMREGLADAGVKARISELGSTLLALSPAGFGNVIAQETAKWATVIRAANIKPE